MSKHDTPSDKTDGTIAQYTGDHGTQMEVPAAIIRLEGDGPQSVGHDATVDVTVDGDRVDLTMTAELNGGDRLLNRDLLTMVLSGRDLPEKDQ